MSWDETYNQVKIRLGREPASWEVQAAMLVAAGMNSKKQLRGTANVKRERHN